MALTMTAMKDKITHNTQTGACVCFAVDVRQEMLEEAQKKLMNLLNTTEGKVDKCVQNTVCIGNIFPIYLDPNIFKRVFL